MRFFCLVCLFLSATSGCAGPDDDPTRLNGPPRAALRAPVIAPLGTPVAFDAGASVDPDGDPLTFIFQLNDGGEAVHSADPRILYSFSREALITVVVYAIDLHGAEGAAAQDVSVRGDYPAQPDYCDALHPCVVGDECDAGVCYANGGSLD